MRAIAQARNAYVNYLRLSIGTPLAKVDNFEPYLTRAALAEQRESLARASRQSLRLSGKIELKKFQVQQIDASGNQLTAYACVDLAKARVRDQAGKDVTPSARVDKQTTLPRFRLSGGRMKLDRDAAWSGKSVC